MKLLIQYIAVYSFLLPLWLISFLPRTIQKKLSVIYALFIYIFLPSRRKVIDANIAIAYPKYTKEERRKLLVKNYFSLGFSIIEMANAWFWSNEKMKAKSVIKGQHFIDEAKENDQGMILIMPHYNNLEILIGVLASHVSINASFSTPKNKVFADFLKKRRLKVTKKMIVSKNFKQLISILKNNELMVYLPDQSKYEKNAPYIPFFSKKVKTTAGTYKLAKLSKAKVVVLYPYFDEKTNKYTIEIQKPLDLEGLDAIEATTKVNKAIESVVYKTPEQYMWIHKRYKECEESN